MKNQEVSFDIDRKLTDEEILKTLKYCQFDVFATYEVFKERKSIFGESYMGFITGISVTNDISEQNALS